MPQRQYYLIQRLRIIMVIIIIVMIIITIITILVIVIVNHNNYSEHLLSPYYVPGPVLSSLHILGL